MQRFLAALMATSLLAPAGSATSQTIPAEITIISVLAMAKDEIEKAPVENERLYPRYRLAQTMRKTAHEHHFGSYVADTYSAYEQQAILNAQGDDIDRMNMEVEINARRAFLAGQVEEAKRILDKCQGGRRPPPPCSPGEFFFWSNEAFLSLKYLSWELETGDKVAALNRLKTAAWPADFWPMVIVMTGPFIAAGDREKGVEIRRLARLSGGEFDSCVVKFPALGKRPGQVQSNGSAAALRKLACDGQAKAALDIALAQKDVVLRSFALGIVAEGLAGIIGYAGEMLTY